MNATLTFAVTLTKPVIDDKTLFESGLIHLSAQKLQSKMIYMVDEDNNEAECKVTELDVKETTEPNIVEIQIEASHYKQDPKFHGGRVRFRPLFDDLLKNKQAQLTLRRVFWY